MLSFQLLSIDITVKSIICIISHIGCALLILVLHSSMSLNNNEFSKLLNSTFSPLNFLKHESSSSNIILKQENSRTPISVRRRKMIQYYFSSCIEIKRGHWLNLLFE
jgi:hypothetical protein